jgi:hypothetical protein
MKNKISPRTISLIFSVMVICFAISFNVLGWVEPTADPPADNVSAPLNTSSAGQSKSGGLILNTGGAVTGLVVDKGSVGIGVTNPISKLQVGTNTVSQQWSGSNPYVLIQGVDNEVATPALTVKDENMGTMFELITTGDSSVGRAYFGGNVGIGTTSPKNMLDVEGGAVIGATYSGTNTASSNGLLVEGNVGIGTTNPQEKLHVAGSVRLGDFGGLALTDGNGRISIYSSAFVNTYLQSEGANRLTLHTDAIKFFTAPAGTAGEGVTWTERMRIANTGNIGIGTTVPSQKLDVAGISLLQERFVIPMDVLATEEEI